MTATLRELDYRPTPLGDLVLRVRNSPALDDAPVYEVKLNGEFLMSSVLNCSEIALANLSLDAWGESRCDVLVGGLGLGYTAAAALAHEQVCRVDVMELLLPVIDWHNRRLVPAAETLISDSRCNLVHGDFFKFVSEEAANAKRQYDVILLDIDHSPEACLHPDHERFYSNGGLQQLANQLRPNGVFGIWSAEPPGQLFMHLLESTFAQVTQHDVDYHNPLFHRTDRNTVVVAQK